MASRYFTGQNVTGQVSVADAQTFSDVVEKLNMCPTLPITRKAFLSLGEKERNEAKQVPFFVPACFQSSPSKRTYEYASHCNLIFLDIDPEKEHRDGKWVETGRCPAAPFVNDPELLYQALHGFNFVAHLTASSTPEKPRMRIIVDADAIPLSSYPDAVKTVAKLLGLPSITKESKVAVQPMYNTVMFKEDTEEQHPVIAHSLSGRALTVQDISSESLPVGKNGTNGHSHTSDGLEFLRASVPEITLAIAKDALSHISADCSYHEWIEIAASLKHQFSPHQEDEAYEIFDEWSATGDKYASADETRAKWDSLRTSPVGREPKTIRSLLRMAVQAGWDDERVKHQGYSALVAWMGTAGNPTILLEQGVRKILATPQLSTTQEGMLLDQLKVHAKDRFQFRVSITDLRKDLQRLRDKAITEKPQEKKKTPPWANGLCFVTTTKEFYRPSNGEKYKPDSFNLKYARKLLPTPKSLIAAGIPVNEATLSKPIVEPTDYVLNYLQLPVFYDYAYAPQSPNEMLFVHEKQKFVNTYAPTYPESDDARAEQAGQLFQRHLANLVAEPEYRKTLTDFMAYQVQFPGRKVRWAVLVQGAEGAGKTYLAEVLKAVLGKRHVKTVDGTTITSGWNEWTFGYQMVVIEEVRVVGTNRFDIMNRLKPWIANDDVTLNEKFRSSRDTMNVTNYILFSNYHDCLALNGNDRRYFVIKSPMQHKSQVLALGKDYFTELFDFLTNHPGAMRAWLLNWQISEDFAPHGHAPRTKYVQDLIDDTASDIAAAVRRLCLEGDYPLVQYDVVSSNAIQLALSMDDGLHKISPQQLAKVLREEGFQQSGRHLVGTERHYLWHREGVSDPLTVATKRVKGNMKHLHMELLYT